MGFLIDLSVWEEGKGLGGGFKCFCGIADWGAQEPKYPMTKYPNTLRSSKLQKNFKHQAPKLGKAGVFGFAGPPLYLGVYAAGQGAGGVKAR